MYRQRTERRRPRICLFSSVWVYSPAEPRPSHTHPCPLPATWMTIPSLGAQGLEPRGGADEARGIADFNIFAPSILPAMRQASLD